MVPIPLTELDNKTDLKEYEEISQKVRTYLKRQFKENLAYTVEEYINKATKCIKEFSGSAPEGVLEAIVTRESNDIVDSEISLTSGIVYTRRAAEKRKEMIETFKRLREKMSNIK